MESLNVKRFWKYKNRISSPRERIAGQQCQSCDLVVSNSRRICIYSVRNDSQRLQRSFY